MKPSEIISSLTQEDWDFLKNNIKRSSVLLGFDFEPFTHFSFGFVKEDSIDLVNRLDVDGLIKLAFQDRTKQLVFDSDLESIDKQGLSFLFWVIDMLEKIDSLEKHNLSSEPDPKMLQAGISEMSEFGVLNTIDALAGGDMLKWDEVRAKPYHYCFNKQLMNLKHAKIAKRLSKIQYDEAKQKRQKK